MLIWIIPAALAALSFFKLGSLYVWVQVMSIAVKVLAAACVLLLASVGGLAIWRIRRHRAF